MYFSMVGNHAACDNPEALHKVCRGLLGHPPWHPQHNQDHCPQQACDGYSQLLHSARHGVHCLYPDQ